MNTLFDVPSADFDEDGLVGGADFLAWQRHYGTLLGASHAMGDSDGDGDVDADDLAAFQLAQGIIISSVSEQPIAKDANTTQSDTMRLRNWS